MNGSDPGPEDRDRAAHAVASAPINAQLKRMQWRCRRGTRELDALLSGWLEAHRGALDAPQLDAFDALLDQQDPMLWDWLMAHAEPSRADWRIIVLDIRKRAGLAR
jgi:antitoxin CptB